MPEVALRIDASPALVRTARQVAVALARRAGFDDEVLDEVRLAVGEACGLAVALAATSADGTVELRYVDDRGLVVEVETAGDLPPARGDEVADVVTARIDSTGGSGDSTGELPAGSTLMVLTTVVPEVDVRTGPDGLRLRLAWPPASPA